MIAILNAFIGKVSKTRTNLSHLTPEEKKEHHKAYAKACMKAYRQTPEGKAYAKAYQQTPEGKAYAKAYQQTPEGKAYAKAYKQTNCLNKRATKNFFQLLDATSKISKIAV